MSRLLEPEQVCSLYNHHILFYLKQRMTEMIRIGKKKAENTNDAGTRTCDLDQKMKTSPTILKSSSASGSGHVNHRALQTKMAKINKLKLQNHL